MHFLRAITAMGIFFQIMAALTPAATAACRHRGDLDELYCDENRDLIADAPSDPILWKDPNTLVFAYTPVEKPEKHKEALSGLMLQLSRATGKKVIYYMSESMSIQVEAMRSGRVHIASFATGPTCFAVNLAGYVPVAANGNANGIQSYRMAVLVKKDGPCKTLADLKGKKVAHTSPLSNSGHLAPMALFPAEGITPGKDYKIVFSGRHDHSIIGLGQGEYDAACVALKAFEHMASTGIVDGEMYRVIWQSSEFPAFSIGYAHNLKPELAEKITSVILKYRFPPQLRSLFSADRFIPTVYERDYKIVRDIYKASGEPYNKAALVKMEIEEQSGGKDKKLIPAAK